MVSECMAIAQRKGLTTIVDGQSDCIVYDTNSISFEEIINEAERNAGSKLGTYRRKSNVIITPMEIIG